MHDRSQGPRKIEARTSNEELLEELDEEAQFEAEKASLVARATSGDLKGAELDEALEKANVPRTGSADERRAALVAKLGGPTPE
jgi:DNA-binding transcriptional regulator YdaS (Cro superfamily)